MFFNGLESQVLSVSILNHVARELLENHLAAVWVRGEVSNLTLAASGHAYFSLKDSKSQVRCVMFRHRLVQQVNVKLREGIEIELTGQVTLYEARGDFQINVETIRIAGIGQLFEAFDRLKTRLAQEGLFNPARKRPLPRYPNTIGIITSPAGAALHDVLITLRRRMPTINIIVYPTQVQGEIAATQIEQAIRLAGERHEVDVLIVCRGGGSLEDLWPFNEERVARAVAASPIPIISGIGHETDFTICDFVADQRAPTPTAAAELASSQRDQLLLYIEQLRRQLYRSLTQKLIDQSQRLDWLAQRLMSPRARLAHQRQQLLNLTQQLKERTRALVWRLSWQLRSLQARFSFPHTMLSRDTQRLTTQLEALQRARDASMTRRRQRLDELEALLHAMDPEAILARGYAIVHKQNGQAARSPSDLSDGEHVMIRLYTGETEAIIVQPQRSLASPTG